MTNLVIETNLLSSNMFCIFVFILIVSANFLAELFPCRLQYVLRNNMSIKHLFGLFTMIFFVVLSSGIENKNIFNITTNAVLLYILFILITKCQIYAFLTILLLLGISYIVHIIKQTEIENDKKDTDKNKYTVYDNITYVMYSLIIITIIIGVILYMGEKKIEYRSEFNYITFFIGKSLCKNESPNANIMNSLKNAFK